MRQFSYQGQVRDKNLIWPGNDETVADQFPVESGDQRLQRLGDIATAGPQQTVVRPTCQTIEMQIERLDLDLPEHLDQRLQSFARNLAKKCQSQMNGLPARRLATKTLGTVLRDAKERFGLIVRRPNGYENTRHDCLYSDTKTGDFSRNVNILLTSSKCAVKYSKRMFEQK